MNTENCKYAFNSAEEKEEWQYLEERLKIVENSPLKIRIRFLENVARIEKHGYVAKLSHLPNWYEITKKE